MSVLTMEREARERRERDKQREADGKLIDFMRILSRN